MNGKVSLCFGGVPTDPDVKRIRERWPDTELKEGDTISYEDVEETIGSARLDTRFQSVTTRWRRLVFKETGKLLECNPNVGFVVASNGEKLNHGQRKLRSAFKAVRRSAEVTETIDRDKLDNEEKGRLDLTRSQQAAFIRSGQLRGKSNLPKLIPDS